METYKQTYIVMIFKFKAFNWFYQPAVENYNTPLL